MLQMLKIFIFFKEFITFCVIKALPVISFLIFANSTFLEILDIYHSFLTTTQNFYTYPHTCDKVGYFYHANGVRSLFGTTIHLPAY